jgi:hypothetical protein
VPRIHAAAAVPPFFFWGGKGECKLNVN